MLIDFHLHTTRTEDATLSAADLVAAAKEKSLDGFCLTDFHTVAGGPEAKELARAEGLIALVGFEARTDRGHFLVFVPQPENLPEIDTWVRSDNENRLSFTSLVEAVGRLQGILIAAHPFDRQVPESPGDALVQLPGVSAVEVLNASRSRLANDLAEEVAAGVGLPGIGASDARTSTQDVGRFATLVRGPVETEAELIDRVRAFDVWPVAIGKPASPPARRAPPRGRGERSRPPRSGKPGDRRRGGPPRGRSGKPGDRDKSGRRPQRRDRNKPPPPKKD